jgi:hypothetical protein
VAAVDATTGAPTSWNPGTNGAVTSIVPDSAGRIYLGGPFTTVRGLSRLHVARVAANGTLDSWKPSVGQVNGPCPPACPPTVLALGLSVDQTTLYIGGRFGLVNGVNRNNAAAVDTTTAGTLAWNPNVMTNHPKNMAQVARVEGMAVGSTRAYLCGDFWLADGVVSSNLVGVDLVTGHRDAAFAANTDGGSPACALKDDRLYVGGHFQQVGPTNGWVYVPGQKATLTGTGTAKRVHLVAFDTSTGAIAAWNPKANSTLGVHALASDPFHLGVGGDFTTIGGIAQQSFGQFSNSS